MVRLPLGRLNQMTILQLRGDFVKRRTDADDDLQNPIKDMSEEAFKFACGTFTLLLQLAPALKELTNHGTRSFHQSLLKIEVRRWLDNDKTAHFAAPSYCACIHTFFRATMCRPLASPDQAQPVQCSFRSPCGKPSWSVLMPWRQKASMLSTRSLLRWGRLSKATSHERQPRACQRAQSFSRRLAEGERRLSWTL